MAIFILGGKMSRDIIVGGYGRAGGWASPNYAGPLGMSWGRENTRARRLFQLHRNQQLIDVEYYNSQGTRIPIYQVNNTDLNIIDRTLNSIPPEHLEWFINHKPEGIIIAEEAGRGGRAKLTGGANPIFDEPTTRFFNEARGILITYGAIWRNRHLGIVPTIFHELGHTLTIRSRISYNYFPQSRSSVLRQTVVSRNPGSMEALCNAYMFFICYGSTDEAIRAYGSGQGSQKDAATRQGLRGCPAFTSMLSGNWINRFVER
ncbi:MAG: hypothetical protein ACI84C_001900 [Flavobacteriales bacterium]|jgi:hypothetical protein